MRKLHVVLIIIIALLSTACISDEKEKAAFDKSKIKIEFKEQFINEYFVGYVIDVKNTTDMTISYLNMYMNLPIMTKGGSKENSFVLVGVPHKEEVHLKSGEMLEYTFEGFVEGLNQGKVDMKNPAIKLTGYIDGDVPFELSRKVKAEKKKSK